MKQTLVGQKYPPKHLTLYVNAPYCKFFMPRPLKQGILGASTIILSKDIDKYAFIIKFYVWFEF